MHTILVLFMIFILALQTTEASVENKKILTDESHSVNTLQNGSPYAENVHMYICMQALHLLKDKYPNFDYTKFDQHIGDMTDEGTRAWQTTKITTGAFREDKEDVVFDVRGLFNWYVSNSHFWNADDRTNGDNTLTYLNSIGHYPNAFTKINRFRDGQWFGWDDDYGPREYINYLHQSGYTFRYSYHTRGLINFFRTRKIWLEDFYDLAGRQNLVRQEVTASDNVFNAVVWEVLGRMSHLLQDLSVPAHTHNDVHVRGLDGGDCYHNFIDDGAYLNYNWQTAKNAGGLINPYADHSDPLRYLAYTTSQLADHFPSGPSCSEIPQQHLGNNFLPGGTNPMIENYYQLLGSPPPNIPDLTMEANYCFNHSIRSVAGLFYWFGVETGLFPTDPDMIPNITGFINSSPDNYLYRGETMNIECIATGNPQTFNFEILVCDTANLCLLPVQGISLSQSQNIFSMTNINFQNYWSCLRYDSLCNSSSGNFSTEPPLHFTIKVTASNQFGSDTKFYGSNNLQWINPNQFLRPNPPPYSGCPFVLVNNGIKFIYDNNLLHRSEHFINTGKYIEDKYILKTTPVVYPQDNTIMLAVKETNIDVNYFDQFRVLIADHPIGTVMGITENNDPVIYTPKYVLSPSHAEISGKNITNHLKYGIQYPKFIKGIENEILTAKFPEASSLPSTSDSVALIFNPGSDGLTPVIPVVKDIAGNITIQDSKGNNEKSDLIFSKRIINSEIILPVFANKGIDALTIEWKDNFQMSYLAYTGINYSGFFTEELELIEAEDLTTGNVLNLVKDKDNNTIQSDSSNQLILKFRNSNSPVKSGYERSYIFITNGRYEKGEKFKSENSISENILKADDSNFENAKFTVGNYPNPFNPKTIINYELPKSDVVSLKVFDVLGNEVMVLVNEKQNAGTYSVEFDGSRFASGIYFYTIRTGDFIQTKKMMLLK
ncbi:MAG: T9SS type A sorting domain-containing protein [Ignavibacteria bacterium]